MDLITVNDLLGANEYLKKFGGERAARAVMHLLQFDKINAYYHSMWQMSTMDFLNGVIEFSGVKIEVDEQDLRKIPTSGPFITVSNHPYGGLDGIFLAAIMTKLNPDYKILVNFLLTRIQPLQPIFLGVNPFESQKSARSSFGGLKEAYNHLKKGHPLGLFPAGEVSSYKLHSRSVTDRSWQYSMLKFLKKSRVPVVPVYFSGYNSLFFNILGFIHPVLRTVKLPSELINKKGKVIHIRIGSPVTVREQDEFRELQEYGRLLRGKTYSLSLALKPEPTRKPTVACIAAPIIDEVPAEVIEKEIDSIMGEHLLFKIQGNHVFCAPSSSIPSIMQEISRLREVTYRSVGEGTNKSFDRDRYDNYFWQLFIWDDSARKIVGGYRVGKGDQILEQYGLGGYYISSLFKIEEAFKPVLKVSLELGRSFIVREYQKKPLSLFLLWKGILYLLLKMPEYRYLIGPVSIPNDYRELSKSLVIDFLMTNSYNAEFGVHIRPRNPFRMLKEKLVDPQLFHRYTNKEIPRLEKFIQDFDPGFRIPVLLKKYLSVNSEVLGFNVDPLFNNCLDALVILDLFEVPTEMIESLSKEINDQSILERFRK